MLITTSRQMALLDRKAIEDFLIPSIVLMENASRIVSRYIINKYSPDTDVIILCGRGNNGGDGLAIARQLIEKNFSPCVFLTCFPEKLTSDSLLQYEILEKIGFTPVICSSIDKYFFVLQTISKKTVLVDALFGTGLSKKPSGIYEEIINLTNSHDFIEVVSVDIPSGVDGTTGQVFDNCAVRADTTITFQYYKSGHLFLPGREYTGNLICENIGIFGKLSDKETKMSLIDEAEVIKNMIPEIDNSHKYSRGVVSFAGGSEDFPGATKFALNGAFCSGAGMVYAFVPKCIKEFVQLQNPSAIVKTLEDKNGYISFQNSVEQFINKQSKCLLIGPGIGTQLCTDEFYIQLLDHYKDKTWIIDADALKTKHITKFLLEVKDTVITPHTGEMDRVIELTGFMNDSYFDENNTFYDKVLIISDFCKFYNTIVVLKTPVTIVFDAKGNIFISPFGNSGLSKGGSGDVLAGIIAGLISQGYKSYEATKIGVYIHGKAGDLIALEKGRKGLTIEKLSEKCSEVLFDIEPNLSLPSERFNNIKGLKNE